MAGTKSKSDKKDRHRKSAQNLRYINERRHAKSHVRRIRSHLKIMEDAREKYRKIDNIRAAKHVAGIDRHMASTSKALEKYQIEAGVFR